MLSTGRFKADPTAFEKYRLVAEAIAATGRQIVHNIKGVPGGGIVADRAREVSNMRRCGGDIGGGFGSAWGSFQGCFPSQHLAGPGFWYRAVAKSPHKILQATNAWSVIESHGSDTNPYLHSSSGVW